MKHAAVVVPRQHSTIREGLIIASEWCDRLTMTPRSFAVLDVALIVLFLLM